MVHIKYIAYGAVVIGVMLATLITTVFVMTTYEWAIWVLAGLLFVVICYLLGVLVSRVWGIPPEEDNKNGG